MIRGAILLVLWGAASPASETELESLRALRARPVDEAATLEELSFLYLKLRLLDRAEEVLNRRERSGSDWSLLGLYRGDIASWRGDLDRALAFYREAEGSVPEAFKETVREKIRFVLEEQDYRGKVRRAARRGLWAGWLALAGLFLLPVLASRALAKK